MKTDFARSSQESQFTLNGALLEWGDVTATMVATDGHRIAIARSALEIPQTARVPKGIVPRKALAEIVKLAGAESDATPVLFARGENHLFFAVGSRLLLTRELTGNFPDYERVVPQAHPHSVILDRAELAGALQRVALFSDERSRCVRIEVKKGELRNAAVSGEGESEESLPIDDAGAELVVGFNAAYLLDFLKAIGDEKISFSFKDGTAAGEFRPVSEKADLYRYVVMPMRV